MKRTIAWIATLVFLLSGCEARSGGSQLKRDVDTARSFAHFNTLVHSVETVDTIYFVGLTDRYIKYVDKATGISGVLCGKPECSHNDESCNAHMESPAYGLLMEDGRLWFVNYKGRYVLYSTALDGNDRREEAELSSEFMPNASGYLTFILDDGNLYMGCVKSTIENGEEADRNWMVVFDVDGDKEPQVILDERTQYSQSTGVPMQIYGEWLYFITNDLEGTWNESRESGESVYDFKIRRWNVATGEIETVYGERYSSLGRNPMDMWIDDEGIMFMGYDYEKDEMGIYKYDFTSGESKYICSTSVTGTVRAGIADGIISGYLLENNNGIYNFHVVIKDFEGEVIVDETYKFDLRDEFAYYIRHQYMLGRDEDYAYYAFTAPPFNSTQYSDPGVKTSTTIIQVALDGSGMRVLCTEIEYM